MKENKHKQIWKCQACGKETPYKPILKRCRCGGHYKEKYITIEE